MAEYPEDLTDSQRLLRKMDDLTDHTRQVRLYLGMLCVLAAVLVLIAVLLATGMVTVEFTPTR